MPTLSTHVLDTERGRPAGGFGITLSRRDGDVWVGVVDAATDRDGRIRDVGGPELQPGTYRISFDAAAYFREEGGDAPFLQTVVIEFRILQGGGHYHVPLLLSRFSCASYRGN